MDPQAAKPQISPPCMSHLPSSTSTPACLVGGCGDIAAIHAHHQRVPLPDPALAGYRTPTMGATLLPMARSGDKRWLVKALLADPVAPDLETAGIAEGNMLLHVVAASGHADLASLLLRRAPCVLVVQAGLRGPGALPVISRPAAGEIQASPGGMDRRAGAGADRRAGATSTGGADGTSPVRGFQVWARLAVVVRGSTSPPSSAPP